MKITELNPTALWKHFQDICNIPHPSKHEEKIIEHIKKFGENLGLETVVDHVGNVIIKKPATAGMENRKTIVLQGHIDMVPQKNNDTKHDFLTDPINAYIDGDWVTADGTTLGADNGMGVAATMAVLESTDISHGPLEGLFTMDEETGMTGAFNLKPDVLNGDILLNLDSEDEGELYIGCAGGIDGNISIDYSEEAVPSNAVAYKVNVGGMKGGHSGMDIILGRGNSNKTLFRFLKFATEKLDVRISKVSGGSLRNAIPRESFATVVVPKKNETTFIEKAKELGAIYIKELAGTEPEMTFDVVSTDMPSSVLDLNAQKSLVLGVYGCPNGVIRMSDSMEGVVETSLNLAIVNTKEGKATVNCLLRSSVDSAKDDLAEMVESVFKLGGANVEFTGEYPGWKPNVDSPILKAMKESYNNKYGKIPEIKVIHAGLECGILGATYPKWDMISFGPTIRFPHSPDEKVKIDTVIKFWDFLVETLKNVPVK